MFRKTFVVLVCISVAFSFSGCSLGFLLSKTQEVSIVKDKAATIQIEKKSPDMIYDKYVLSRDGEPKQAIITKPGYKPQYWVCMPYKLSGAGIATIALNATVVAIPVTIMSYGSGAGFMSVWFSFIGASAGGICGYYPIMFNPKFFEYDKTIMMNDSMLLIPVKDSLSKEIFLNKVAVDIAPNAAEDYNMSYKNYKIRKFNIKMNIKSENGLKIDDTFFSDELNSTLKKNGFIDTTGLVLKSNYSQNAYLDATILGYKWIFVPNSVTPKDARKTGFINVELNVKWDVLDFYKNLIYSDTINARSGEFVSYVSGANSTFSKDAMKDALETGMYTLMNKDRFRKCMQVPVKSVNDSLKSIEINSPKAFVGNIEQAVQATVTVKTKNGHGSGFFISDDGYVVTNYHVIADSAKLEVILNDGFKTPAHIVRYNKESDLALLKVDKKNIVPFRLDENEQAGMGKEIYVIGTPSAEDLSQTLTKGIISSIRKQANGSKIIQTDASISHGNSGGPLISKEGKLLGIVNAKLVGMGIEGISFAIPEAEILNSLVIKLK